MVHEFYPVVYYNFKMEEGFTKEKLNEFFDDSNDFLCLPNILPKLAQLDQK